MVPIADVTGIRLVGVAGEADGEVSIVSVDGVDYSLRAPIDPWTIAPPDRRRRLFLAPRDTAVQSDRWRSSARVCNFVVVRYPSERTQAESRNAQQEDRDAQRDRIDYDDEVALAIDEATGLVLLEIAVRWIDHHHRRELTCVLPLSSGRPLIRGERVSVHCTAEADMRVGRIVLGGRPDDWSVDVMIDGASQFVQSMPGVAFSFTSMGSFVSIGTLWAGSRLEMLVEYVGEGDLGAMFNAAVIGSSYGPSAPRVVARWSEDGLDLPWLVADL